MLPRPSGGRICPLVDTEDSTLLLVVGRVILCRPISGRSSMELRRWKRIEASNSPELVGGRERPSMIVFVPQLILAAPLAPVLCEGIADAPEDGSCFTADKASAALVAVAGRLMLDRGGSRIAGSPEAVMGRMGP